jgi:hypothetical protein
LTKLGDLLREGSLTATVSQSDPQFDGGSTLLIEASYSGTVDEVSQAVVGRLEAAGYTATCPGARDDIPPSGQENTIDPRQTCRVTGHGTDGTLWLGTTPGNGVQLSAIVGS